MMAGDSDLSRRAGALQRNPARKKSGDGLGAGIRSASDGNFAEFPDRPSSIRRADGHFERRGFRDADPAHRGKPDVAVLPAPAGVRPIAQPARFGDHRARPAGYAVRPDSRYLRSVSCDALAGRPVGHVCPVSGLELGRRGDLPRDPRKMFRDCRRPARSPQRKTLPLTLLSFITQRHAALQVRAWWPGRAALWYIRPALKPFYAVTCRRIFGMLSQRMCP